MKTADSSQQEMHAEEEGDKDMDGDVAMEKEVIDVENSRGVDNSQHQKRPKKDNASGSHMEPPPGLGAVASQQGGEASMQAILDAIKQSDTGNAQRHLELRRDLGKVDRDLREVKATAAKALVTSTEAKQEIQVLRDRLDRVEKEGLSNCSTASSVSGGGGGHRFPTDHPKEIDHSLMPRQELLGGATGGECIIGGFPAWSRKAQLLDWGEKLIKPAYSVELQERLEELTAPGKRGSILVVRFAAGEGGEKAENRKLMFKAIRELNDAKLQLALQGETYSLWSGPSKPAYLRAQDQKVTEALNILRKLADEPRIDYDYPKQRLFLDDRLVASRPPSSEKLEFRHAVLGVLIRDYKPEKIEEARALVRKERDDKREKQ